MILVIFCVMEYMAKKKRKAQTTERSNVQHACETAG